VSNWTERDYRIWRIYRHVEAIGWDLTYTGDKLRSMSDTELDDLEADMAAESQRRLRSK